MTGIVLTIVVAVIFWYIFRLKILRPLIGWRGLRLFDAVIFTMLSAYSFATGSPGWGTFQLFIAVLDTYRFINWKEPVKA